MKSRQKFLRNSVLVTNKGSILTITQGRQLEGGDNAQNDLVLRRSTDGGATFEPMQVNEKTH
jgi:sialidase-1